MDNPWVAVVWETLWTVEVVERSLQRVLQVGMAWYIYSATDKKEGAQIYQYVVVDLEYS